MERKELVAKIDTYIRDTFKDYTIQHDPESNNFYIYIQDPLQKDLNITDRVPYVSLSLQYIWRKRFRHTANCHDYKIVWHTNPTAGISKTYWDDNLIEKGTIGRIIKRKIKKVQEAIEHQKKYMEERKQKEALQAEEKRLRLEKVKQFLDEKEVGYTLDEYGSYYQLTTAPNVHVYRVTDVCIEMYVWDRTMRYVKKEQFMDVITAAHTVYYNTFDREPI